MLSASANTLHPAFFNRTPDRVLTSTSSIPDGRQLSREQLRVWSYQEPPLAVGQYTLSVSQKIEVFDSNVNQDVSKDLNSPDTQLRVSSPRFQLTDPQVDIHSVYPASGHSDHAQTLAHVVFRRCTAPWERRLVNDKGEWDNCGMNNNRMPWLCVLSFTEDELVLDEAKCHAAGFTDAASRPSSQGTITTTAGHLENLTGVVSPLSGNAGLSDDDKNYAAGDEADVLLMARPLFQRLFASYNRAGESPFKPDLTRFSRMAHVRETHAGFMASTVDLMSDSGAGPDPQPQYSVVVSPRTGPPGEEKPRRVISHLISLEGVSRMTSELQPQAEHAALVSLFSWDWMCVPNDHVDFRNTMAALGNNVRPLRIDIPDEYQKQLDEAERDEKAKRSPMANWLRQKTHAGYTMKPHTLPTGEKTMSLVRGPFIPVAPARDSINCFSATGEDLVLVDSETGIADISYNVAWHLGRALAMADRSLMAALLRFRGHVHAEAVKRLKARNALKAKAAGNDKDVASGVFTMAAAFASLDDSVSQLEKASDLSALGQLGGHSRWLRTEDERKDSLVSRLSLASAPLNLDGDDYAEELRAVVNAFFGYPPAEPDSKPEIPPIPQREINPDAVLIRAWTVDKLYLAGVPLHNLLPDPDMLPRESIRTFCVDPKWLDCAIDGGLSTANHFANGDDIVRQAIKKCMNRYMGEVRTHGPGKGTTLQLPKWGFLLRSVAVTAFPDLKVEAQFGKAVPDGIREVLYMQVLADDVLLCLFDRMPGDDDFKEVRISQPSHQQSFAAGSKLTSTMLCGWFRPIPRVTLSSVAEDEQEKVRQMLVPIERKCESGRDSEPAYDWDVRMIRPDVLSKQYVAAVAGPERDETKVWKWTGAADDVPSAVLALQLSTANLQLTLSLDKGDWSSGNDSNDDNRWTKPGVQLDAEPRAKALPTGIRKPASVSTARTAVQHRQRTPVKHLEWVALPTNPSPSMAATTMVVALEETLPRHNITAQGLHHQDTDMVILPHITHAEKTTWCPWPSKAACFSLFDPDLRQETSPDWREGGSTVVALRGPTDLVFALRQSSKDSDSGGKYPERLEVRIPVVLSQERAPSGGSDEIKPLLIIPGTAEAPVLPKVEGLNGSGLWSYKTSLVVGSLFCPPADGAKKGDGLQACPNKCLLLVITAQPRFGKGRMKDAFFDGSFMLHQGRVIQPDNAAPYATQFDVSWEQNVAYPRQVIVERGVMLKIGEPSYLEIFNREKVCLNLTMHTSSVLGPDDKVKWEVEMRTATEKIPMTFSLSPGDLCQVTTDNQKNDYNFQELANKGPVTVQLYAESASGRRLGPKTPPMTFPQISLPDYPGQVTFTFSYAGIYASWETPPNLPEISGTDKPYKVHFNVGQRPDSNDLPTISLPLDTDVEADKAFLEHGVHIAESDFAPEKLIRIKHQLRIESKRLKGVVEERLNDFALLHLSTKAQFAILSPLDLSTAPHVHPRSQFVTWAKTSEIWYVADDNSIVGIRCRRKPQEDTTLSSIATLSQSQGQVKSVGTLAMFPRDSSFSKHMIAWVRPDGALGGVERTVSDVHETPNHDWSLVDSLYRMGYIWPIVHSFGAMAVARTYDQLLHMLWAGPKGDLRMTFSELDGPWGGRPEWPITMFSQAGHIPKSIRGEGEVAVDVSKAIFASGHQGGGSQQHFFWVTRGGGLRWMRFFHSTEPKLIEGFSVSEPGAIIDTEILEATDDARIADHGGSFSGCGPVTVSTRFAGQRKLFIFWVDGQEGRIWGKSALVDDLLGYKSWTPKFCVTPKGSAWPTSPAHPTASRLTVIAKDKDSFGPEGLVSAEPRDGGHGIYLLWFDMEGRLRAARMTDDHRFKKEWTECMLPDDVVREVRTCPPPKENDTERKMEVVVLRSTDGESPNANVYDLLWVDQDNRLRDIGVEIQSAWSPWTMAMEPLTNA
ncbi:hypothetical protein BBK36DRAFT_1127295 [Trichoderma citrinoviride]|uniref:Uncharacterized protein n=1 Tax=Trichoderma citrinoviride TaxID=58853 RepID=A0A2T4B150_9HYPO|nr:hypothetical protein BBK36DRAFT_1127295 [Trichoderma citrinoviride]PTB63055.1 hypothetical protein BBK36DRAFT_1127295 [Trichoderma citrinoviride]